MVGTALGGLVAAATLFASGGVAAAEGSSAPGSAGAPVVDPNNGGAGCPDLLVVAASGAGDSTVDRDPFADKNQLPGANWLNRITVSLGQANRDQPGTVGWMYVPYPSTYGLGLLADVPT